MRHRLYIRTLRVLYSQISPGNLDCHQCRWRRPGTYRCRCLPCGCTLRGLHLGQCSLLWIVLVSLLMSIGEMVFSPLGNSFITMLAPAKVMGALLGFWPIAVFFATLIYPKLYAYLKTVPFQIGYGIVAAVVIVMGIILWLLSGRLDQLAKAE